MYVSVLCVYSWFLTRAEHSYQFLGYTICLYLHTDKVLIFGRDILILVCGFQN